MVASGFPKNCSRGGLLRRPVMGADSTAFLLFLSEGRLSWDIGRLARQGDLPKQGRFDFRALPGLLLVGHEQYLCHYHLHHQISVKLT